MYSVKLRSVGNPDFGQYAPVSEPMLVRAETLRGILKAAEIYREHWNLGGGNWVTPPVKDGRGKIVGWITYNGRLVDREPRTCSYVGEDRPKDVQL